jgi:hypothetical protein
VLVGADRVGHGGGGNAREVDDEVGCVLGAGGWRGANSADGLLAAPVRGSVWWSLPLFPAPPWLCKQFHPTYNHYPDLGRLYR